MSKIHETDLKQVGNNLQMTLKLTSQGASTEISDEIVLCGLIKCLIKSNVTVKFQSQYYNNSSYYQTISIKLSKTFESDRLIYIVKLSSVKLNIAGKTFFILDDNIDNVCWQTFYEHDNTFFEFDLALSLNSDSFIFSGFNSLHEDTELTDFELRGIDGSVKVHKAVLAGYSPVMKTMLAGQWRETASSFVEVTNASKKTLDQLKDFMYLHKLPENGIEELAVIASVYMMSDLEECCTVKLLTSLTVDNAVDLLDFSVKYNMERLKLGILENVQRGLIKVKDMVKKSGTRKLQENQPS